MPYLELKKEEENIEEVTVPNIVGLSIREAKNILKEIGLELIYEENIGEETIIKEQSPIEGIKINKGNKIIIKY